MRLSVETSTLSPTCPLPHLDTIRGWAELRHEWLRDHSLIYYLPGPSTLRLSKFLFTTSFVQGVECTALLIEMNQHKDKYLIENLRPRCWIGRNGSAGKVPVTQAERSVFESSALRVERGYERHSTLTSGFHLQTHGTYTNK